MFEIRCIVPDKRLGETLRALEPFTLEPPVVQPGKEPAKKNGNEHSLVDMPHGSADTPSAVVDRVVALGSGTRFKASDLRNMCKAIKRPEYSYTYRLSQLVKSKAVKKIGPTAYEVA